MMHGQENFKLWIGVCMLGLTPGLHVGECLASSGCRFTLWYTPVGKH